MFLTVSNNQKSNVVAAIITYHPDDGFAQRFQAIARQVAHTIIVDNGSSSQTISHLKKLTYASSVTLILNKSNLGVAKALNQASNQAIAMGFKFLVSFDQDSLIEAGMINALVKSFYAYPEPQRVSMVGANITYFDVSKPYKWTRARQSFSFFFERITCNTHDLIGVTKVISSGALMNLKAFKGIGGFQDSLFIDYVDTDYCLRSINAGYVNLVSAKAKMSHSLGSKRKASKIVAIYPTFHSPLRLYYISRNRIFMIRKHALRFPHWFFFDIVAFFYNLLRVILFEDKRIKKLQAIAEGNFDGFRGLSGKSHKEFS